MILPWAKYFKSMYEGSMYGSGVEVFAVWGYVIANTDRGRVELNPKRLADTLGSTIDKMEKAIHFLESPDPKSRHKERDGCRLIRESEYQFFVPCWEVYQKIRNEEQRQEQNRNAQAKFREKNKMTPAEKVAARNKAAEKTEEAAKAKMKEKFEQPPQDDTPQPPDFDDPPTEFENKQDDSDANFNEFP